MKEPDADYDEHLDPFRSISDPIELLVTASQEFQAWGEAISNELYPELVDDQISSNKEAYPKRGKRFVYEETEHFIGEVLTGEFRNGVHHELIATYAHKELITANVADSIVLEATGLLRIFEEKFNEMLERYQYHLRYSMFEGLLDELGEHYGERAKRRFKPRKKVSLAEYEAAFEEVRSFLRYVDARKFGVRLEELAARLKVYCRFEAGSSAKIDMLEASIRERAVRRLLEKDVVRAVVQVLGKEKKKRSQITGETEYKDGGHLGGTLAMLSKEGILIHERPFYKVNPKYYDLLDHLLEGVQ